MVVERDEKWVPQFPSNPSRRFGPSSSTPTGRNGGGGSVTPSSPNSSDDEAVSALCITNRCSPKSVFSLVSNLSEFKKQIVRDMGFGGILEIPCISKLNLKLSAWLLSKLDSEESCLIFGPGRRIYVHEDDVGIVLGIPNGDIDVSTTSVTKEQLELLRFSIGLASTDPRSIKGIEYVLEKHLDDQSSSQQIDGFKVAFVVFIIGHLLAPCVKHDQVHLDFWGALKNHAALERYNWCRYVYGHVLEVAQKVRSEIINKGRATSLSGCHYFLQILFLDNVDLSRLNKPHKVVPRLKVFDQESLKLMAMMCASRGEQDFTSFIGIRSAESSGYMRHIFPSPHTTPSSSTIPSRVTIPFVRKTEQGNIDSFLPLSPQNVPFKSPSDFYSYIHRRHPGMERTYFIDYIKNHNASMMRDISEMRSSITRRNAHLVDWLVDNVGPLKMQLIHKKPAVSGCSTPIAPSSITPSDRGHDVSMHTKSTYMTTKRSVCSSEVTPAKKLKSSTGADFGVETPSFDLGIDGSIAVGVEVTPQHIIFAIDPFKYPMQSVSRGVAPARPSCGLAEVSPADSSRHLAQCVVLDIIHVTEEGIDPNGKVLYGQWITQPFQKCVAPDAPVPCVPWAPELLHLKHDPTAVNDLIICCNDLSEAAVRCEWLVHQLPRYLVLSGSELINTFVQGKDADSDIIDAAFWHFCRLDASVKCPGPPGRWRHFIESDFAMNCLASYNPERILSVLNQFTKVDYCLPSCQMVHHTRFLSPPTSVTDIQNRLITFCFLPPLWVLYCAHVHLFPRCGQIIVPVLVDHIWCAYMFDSHGCTVHVLDRAHAESRHQAHMEIFKILHDSLSSCLEHFFKGWSLKPFDSWNDSGIVMLHYARNFNGGQLNEQVTKDNILSIRLSMFADILMLDGNEAKLPAPILKFLPK